MFFKWNSMFIPKINYKYNRCAYYNYCTFMVIQLQPQIMKHHPAQYLTAGVIDPITYISTFFIPISWCIRCTLKIMHIIMASKVRYTLLPRKFTRGIHKSLSLLLQLTISSKESIPYISSAKGNIIFINGLRQRQ